MFGALRDAGVSVMMISQGSSEHSICFAVKDETADNVRKVAEKSGFAPRQPVIEVRGTCEDCA